MSDQGPPAGWYPHPGMAQTLRYWDGTAFTGDLAPAPYQGPAPTGEVSDTVQTIGWVCAFVFPIVGFVIGCLCVSQGPKSEGWWMIVVSVIFAGIGASFFLGLASSTTYA